jgi:hypothetical protein
MQNGHFPSPFLAEAASSVTRRNSAVVREDILPLEFHLSRQIWFSDYR